MKTKPVSFKVTARSLGGTVAAILLGAAALPSATQAQSLPAPLLHYTFDDGGANSGTLADANLTTTGVGSFGGPGTGVTGQSWDHAFVNANGGMGASNTPYNGSARANSADLPELSSFTITGWFKTPPSIQLSSSAALFRTSDGSIVLKADLQTAGTMTLTVNGKTSERSALDDGGVASLYRQTDTWVFFAVTWDGSSVQFYDGSTTIAVTTLSSARPLSATAVNPSAGFLLGNNGEPISANARPFAGSLDNIRLYSDVLTLSQIEAIRTGDLLGPTIPEPASSALLLGLGCALWAGTRRVRNR